jgi:actin cytoskeleton-regulatory complex protein END3
VKPAQRWGADGDQETSTGRKAKFGDTYLSRLGVGGGRGVSKGTDFSATKTDEDWEEVRLKKQLADLEAKMSRVEAAAEEKRSGKGGRRNDSKPALVKRELEQLLEYKRRELRELEDGEGSSKVGQGLKQVEEEIGTVREQVEGLEKHLRTREEVLEGLRREIEEEKRAR